MGFGGGTGWLLCALMAFRISWVGSNFCVSAKVFVVGGRSSLAFTPCSFPFPAGGSVAVSGDREEGGF